MIEPELAVLRLLVVYDFVLELVLCFGATAWRSLLREDRVYELSPPELEPEPPREPQTGQAPMPWDFLTFSATAICSERDAPSGLPLPPLAAQVDGVNCRPPEKPLPVLVPQLPPDSHCATASQLVA